MKLFTIGFTQKSAERFFGLIKSNNIELVLDVRLNNTSQLAGFSKGDDLRFFLKEICNCDYEHGVEYAPAKDTLDRYKKGIINWDGYVDEYIPLMQNRKIPQKFLKNHSELSNVCLLCSEPTSEKCHRRLIAELIVEASEKSVEIIHL